MSEKTTQTFWKWIYRDKSGNLAITLVFYNEDGVSPYGLKISDVGTPIEKLNTQFAILHNWKIKSADAL
jgi:hypothetical protein